jgi:hypothetical protein
VIAPIHDGIYGYRTKATIPKIGKKWTYRGKKLSYVNARCEDGRLQAKADFTFNDGTFLTGTFLRPCTVRG